MFQSLPDFLSYSNVISFNPSGPVIRDWPFVVRLQCKYHRYDWLYVINIFWSPTCISCVIKILGRLWCLCFFFFNFNTNFHLTVAGFFTPSKLVFIPNYKEVQFSKDSQQQNKRLSLWHKMVCFFCFFYVNWFLNVDTQDNILKIQMWTKGRIIGRVTPFLILFLNLLNSVWGGNF